MIKKLWELFITFFKIGAFTFGGGWAMISVIQREAVEEHGWVSDDDILDIVAIAESTPGPIAINSATFVGYKVCGFWGSFFATLGVVVPSFAIIFIISNVLGQFRGIKAVEYAFYGIRAGVLALIIKTLFTMYKKVKKGIVPYILMALAFTLVVLFKVNVFIVIILSGILGLAFSKAEERRNNK